MSFMIEVYVKPSANAGSESALTREVAAVGGHLDYREEEGETRGVCLTYEFETYEAAEQAAKKIREQGRHVEGPQDYGP